MSRTPKFEAGDFSKTARDMGFTPEAAALLGKFSMTTKPIPAPVAKEGASTPSFGELHASMAHFGPSGNGTPQISDGDSARVLFFFNLSGAYDGYAGAPQARADAEIIAHRVNTQPDLFRMLTCARDALDYCVGELQAGDPFVTKVRATIKAANRELARAAISSAEGRTP